MKHRIYIVHSNNLEALYINNKLIHQDRHIPSMEILLFIKTNIPGSAKLNDLIPDEWSADESWIRDAEVFPEQFEDVKLLF